MHPRFRSLAAGAAATALLATAAIGMSSASAEVIQIDGASITGSLTVAGKDAALPVGTSVSGSYDDESGALALTVTAPQGQLVAAVAGVGDVPVLYQLSNPGGVNGTVTDGAVTATGNFQLDIVRAELGAGVDLAPCSFGPIEMELTGTLADNVLTLSDPDFTIPSTTDACAGLASLIDPQVASQGNTANLVANLDLPAEQPTTTSTSTTQPTESTTTTEPTGSTETTTTMANGSDGGGAAAPAAGARPVAGSANYTG